MVEERREHRLGVRLGPLDQSAVDRGATDLLLGLDVELALVPGLLVEELADLLKYQRAFQASSRVFTIVDELLDTHHEWAARIRRAGGTGEETRSERKEGMNLLDALHRLLADPPLPDHVAPAALDATTTATSTAPIGWGARSGVGAAVVVHRRLAAEDPPGGYVHLGEVRGERQRWRIPRQAL